MVNWKRFGQFFKDYVFIYRNATANCRAAKTWYGYNSVDR